MKLLIIEDDPRLTLALYRALGSVYKVHNVITGLAAIQHVQSNTYDVIVLDLGLPDISGLQVCEHLRANDVNTPILILTGDTDTKSKVDLLDSGANDYLTKPFSIDELRARLRALLRSVPGGKTGRVRLVAGDLVMDTAKHSVERAGQPIMLTRKEFGILECLLTHSGQVISRSMLAQRVWDEDWTAGTNTIDVHIKYLRDKIDRPFAAPLLKTVHGLGYKIDASKLVAKE